MFAALCRVVKMQCTVLCVISVCLSAYPPDSVCLSVCLSVHRDMCLRYAELETKLGEIDRARALYIHGSQMSDPRVSGGASRHRQCSLFLSAPTVARYCPLLLSDACQCSIMKSSMGRN